ncbi:MAG: TylF/MycF family methyltransferase [Acetobacteraceae bacterium]|nr:TylF/MycF family methyltransferase [Acetobacteraceae bacterium]
MYTDLEPEFHAVHGLCQPHSMTSIERMHALWTAVRHVVRAGIPGDIVECGVWRGGSMMMAAHALRQIGGTDRTLWLYDTFAGMTPPEAMDLQAESGATAEQVLADNPREDGNVFWGIARRPLVEANMATTLYPPARIRYVEGPVEDTIPGTLPDRIALLRLDTDWYRSTKHELVHLWPRLERGGVLIIDDYGYWTGSRRATDEFLATLPDPPMLHRIDATGRAAVKR